MQAIIAFVGMFKRIAGSPMSRNLTLAFETWDSLNLNRPHSTSHKRRVPHRGTGVPSGSGSGSGHHVFVFVTRVGDHDPNPTAASFPSMQIQLHCLEGL